MSTATITRRDAELLARIQRESTPLPRLVPEQLTQLRQQNDKLARALYEQRIKHYGTTPALAWDLKYFQHRMVRQGDLSRSFCPPAPFHPELAAAVHGAITTPNGRLAAAYSRHFAKSTYGCEWGTLRAGAEELRSNIVIVGASSQEKEYQTRLRNVTREIETNERLLRDYPGLAPKRDPKGGWVAYNDSELVLSNGVRIGAMPFGGNIRGQSYESRRPDLIFLDDPETRKMVRSKEQLLEARRWILEDLLGALAPGGAIIWLGTYLAYDCLLKWAGKPKPEGQGWRGPFVPIEDECQEPAWPALFPFEECRRLEIEQGPRAYAIERLLKPQPDSDKLFTRASFELNTFERSLLRQVNGQWELAGRPLSVYQRVDPAGGAYTDRNDFFALATVGLDRSTEMLYLLDLYRGRIPYGQQVKVCQELYDYWQPSRQRIEENQVQVWLKQGVLAERAMRVEGIKTTKAKYERIESWSILVANGKVKFDLTQHAQRELAYEEAEEYPLSAHDDGLDSVSGACEDALELAGGGGGDPEGIEVHGTRESYSATRGF